MKKQISYAIFTDKGGRAVNEDSVGALQNGDCCCFVLCDGLGGHGMGDAASSLVVNVLENQFQKTSDMVNFLGQSIVAAQDVLLAEQIAQNAGKKMKTTCVAIVTDEEKAYIGHVGDSRAYVFSKNKVKLRTLDHSIPQMLVVSGEIKEKEIRNHPERNMLLRVMGIPWEEPQYELQEPLPLKKCQAFLLCSDGFWELIEEKDMCALLKQSKSAKEWLESMAALVKANGTDRNMDNYSAVAVWVQ